MFRIRMGKRINYRWFQPKFRLLHFCFEHFSFVQCGFEVVADHPAARLPSSFFGREGIEEGLFSLRVRHDPVGIIAGFLKQLPVLFLSFCGRYR